MNVDAVDSVVALLHHVHAPPGEAVRPLGQAHHQHRPAEVDEREGLDRDGSARDGIDQLRGHVLVKKCHIKHHILPYVTNIAIDFTSKSLAL